MKIKVHLHTILQQGLPEETLNKLIIDLPEASTLVDLIEHLNIQLGSKSLTLAVNGRTAEEVQVLKDGDVVHLIPAISGG